MHTLSDIPYEVHRLIAVLALGFFALGVAVVPLRRFRVATTEAGAALVLVPALLLVLVAGGVGWTLAWEGEPDVLSAPLAGVACAFAWISGMQLRNTQLRVPARIAVVVPFVIVAGILWTRDSPPALGAAAAARAFEASPGQVGNRYVCRRFSSTDDQYGVAGTQFECDPAHCKVQGCSDWWIAFDGAGRIRRAMSPGGG